MFPANSVTNVLSQTRITKSLRRHHHLRKELNNEFTCNRNRKSSLMSYICLMWLYIYLYIWANCIKSYVNICWALFFFGTTVWGIFYILDKLARGFWKTKNLQLGGSITFKNMLTWAMLLEIMLTFFLWTSPGMAIYIWNN